MVAFIPLWAAPCLRYSAASEGLSPLHKACVAGNLEHLEIVFQALSPEQKVQAANMRSASASELPHLTPLLAVLTSDEFATARFQRDEGTIVRFGKILVLLVQSGADIKTLAHGQEDSLLYFLTIWASIPGQSHMLALLRSFRDQLLGSGPDAGRAFTADDRLQILNQQQHFIGKYLTPLEFVFTHRRSTEVVEILIETSAGLLQPAHLDAYLKFCLEKLDELCNNYSESVINDCYKLLYEQYPEASDEDIELMATDSISVVPTDYFGIDPEFVGCLLQYIRLCIVHGASPELFLDSFVCTDRAALMASIKPCQFRLSEEELASSPDHRASADRHLAQIESLKITLALVYQRADEALAHQQALEASRFLLRLLS